MAYANGDDPSSAIKIANIEDAGAGWTSAISSPYGQQAAAFYNGSLYVVPSGRPIATSPDDALYRIDFTDSMTVLDVVKVADMSGDTVQWNYNDDIAIDPITGILYGRSDFNDQANSQRSSYLYSFDLNLSVFTMIAQETYPFDYVNSENNPPATGFRKASIGLVVGKDGLLYGTSGGGDIGIIDTTTGAWTNSAKFNPSDGDGGVGGDLGGRSSHGAISTAVVTVEVRDSSDTGNTPPIALDDEFNTHTDVSLTSDLFANDGDPDGDAIAIQDPVTKEAATTPVVIATDQGGSVTIYTDGIFYICTDSWIYRRRYIRLCDHRSFRRS